MSPLGNKSDNFILGKIYDLLAGTVGSTGSKDSSYLLGRLYDLLAAGSSAASQQTANRVFAGPPTGVATVPTFRALVAADMPAAIFPKRASLRLEESIVSSGTMTALADSAVIGCLTVQSGGADATSFTNGCVLLAGTYSLSVIGITDSNRGKVDWYVDGVKVVSGQDWYSAATVKNVVKTTASISVTTSGWHTITGTVNGKNGSSSSYYISISRAWFTPASD